MYLIKHIVKDQPNLPSYSPSFNHHGIMDGYWQLILPSLSTLSKNPMTAMSLSATKAFASSTVARVLAGGPVFFSSQETMVSAVRPVKDDCECYEDFSDQFIKAGNAPPLYSVSFPFLKNLRVG